MTLEQQIAQAFLEAYKAKNTQEISVLRMLKTSLANKKIEKLIAKEDSLPDAEALAVLKSELKKRLDSVSVYQSANKQDLADQEQWEADFISKFLPEQLSEEKIRELVKETLTELGNPPASDFGKVMSLVMAKANGSADGSIVSKLVKEEISKN